MINAAISVTTSAVQHLGQLAIDEAKYLYQVKSKVEELIDELQWMQVFLEDIDTRWIASEDKLVGLWISQIYDFSYDAEDTVDKYIHRVLGKRQKGALNTIKWFCFMSCNAGDAKTLHEVGSEIDSLTQKIARLTSRMQTYKIKPKISEGPSLSSSLMKKLKTTTPRYWEPFIGKGKDIKEWIDKLAYGGHVVLYGPGGSGKTNLALAAYSDKGVADHYHRRAWVPITKNSTAQLIFTDILFGLCADDVEETVKLTRDIRKRGKILNVENRIDDILKKWRCFVVLDDVTMEAWSKLKEGFKHIESISKCQLLCSMQSGCEPEDLHGATLHKASQLTYDDGRYLLREKANLTNHVRGMNDKTQLLEAMLPKCWGRPSLIVQLGGILSTLEDVRDWQTVKDGIITAENYEDSLSRVNEMSYRFLPNQLKPVILYLAMFRPKHKIQTRKLYPWWIAEGMITPREGESTEELAEAYLCELVHRGMVQAHAVDEKTKTIETVRLHDSMRDLCLRIAKQDNFLNVVSSHPDSMSPLRSPSRSIRRLAIHMDENLHKYYRNHADKMADNAPYVRSVLLFVIENCGPKWVEEWIKIKSKNYPSLRVLVLEYAACLIGLPKQIGNFIHLRVLSFKSCGFRHGYQLPSTIGNLRSLEILDLRADDLIIIPNFFPGLKQLVHLYFPFRHKARRFEKFQLDSLIHLKTLKNLNLRECSDRVISYSLEELQSISVPNRVSKKDYSKLKYLVMHPIIRLDRLTKHLALDVKYGIFSKDPQILTKCESLSRLTIWSGKLNYDTFSEVILSLKTLRNLSELAFEKTILDKDPMLLLGKLPNLKSLRLNDNSYGANDMVIRSNEDDFPQLTHLTISRLRDLERFSVEEGAMPNLLDLRIINCDKLKTVSFTFPNLSFLELDFLSGLEKRTVVESMPGHTRLEIGDGIYNLQKKKKMMIPPTVKISHSSCVGGEDDESHNEDGESSGWRVIQVVDSPP